MQACLKSSVVLFASQYSCFYEQRKPLLVLSLQSLHDTLCEQLCTAG